VLSFDSPYCGFFFLERCCFVYFWFLFLHLTCSRNLLLSRLVVVMPYLFLHLPILAPYLPSRLAIVSPCCWHALLVSHFACCHTLLFHALLLCLVDFTPCSCALLLFTIMPCYCRTLLFSHLVALLLLPRHHVSLPCHDALLFTIFRYLLAPPIITLLPC